ncbi:hypothetical protein ACEWY4_010715 [Coilia grayii]|uniref:Tetratricopeptide repeat protein 24 n=1 Tax=Coilia grayii TaxID=363190 RepID=A0ABD1K2R4_9TELE
MYHRNLKGFKRGGYAGSLVFGTTGLVSVLSGEDKSTGETLVSKRAECTGALVSGEAGRTQDLVCKNAVCAGGDVVSRPSPEALPAAELCSQVQTSSKAGERAFRDGHTSAALTHLKRAYLLSCDLPCAQQQYRCVFNLAAAYLLASEPRKALQCLLRCQQFACCLSNKDDNHHPNLLFNWGNDPDLLFNLGLAYEGLGQLGDALGCYQAAVGLHGQEDPSKQADAQVKGAYCQLALGERGAAAQSFALAAEGYRQAGRGEEAAMALVEAANQMIARGRGLHYGVGGAMSLLQDCLQLCREEVKDDRLRVKLQTDVGLLLCGLGLFREAECCLMGALAMCEKEAGRGRVRQRAVLLQNLGAVLNAQGHYAAAMPFHTKATIAFRSLGQSHGEAECLGNMASACHHLGRYQAAAQLYQDALAAFTHAGPEADEGRPDCSSSPPAWMRWQRWKEVVVDRRR